MAVNKVIYGGNTLVDLSGDTVTPETLMAGIIAHDKSGDIITGLMEGGGGADWTEFYDVFATGTFTPAEDITAISIDTGVPFDSNQGKSFLKQRLVIMREVDGTSILGLVLAVITSLSKSKTDSSAAGNNGGCIYSLTGVFAARWFRSTETTFPTEGETVWNITLNNNSRLCAGKIYRWMLFGELK